jgi:hypothetical protein
MQGIIGRAEENEMPPAIARPPAGEWNKSTSSYGVWFGVFLFYTLW